MMDKIREIRFPDLELSKQDKSDKYGYHWIETKYDSNRRTQQCVLLKEDDDCGYYLPLAAPYEICRKNNFPKNDGSFYCVESKEPEYKALKTFVPDGVFMPTLEYCNSITPAEWFDAFISIVTAFPEKIDNITDFSFWVSSDDPLYDGFYLKCRPFVNMCKTDAGVVSYKDERSWAVKDTHSIKIDGEYTNHTGNVYFYYKEYMEDYFSGRLLPIIRIKKQ